jgi:ferredoxin
MLLEFFGPSRSSQLLICNLPGFHLGLFNLYPATIPTSVRRIESMATMITTDCINCGACEPECPNNAISQGETIFVIDPMLCTECVGFHDYEACAAVCPVDCCVTDPNNIETEASLIERARALHPDTRFDDNFESRFRKGQDVGGRKSKKDVPVAASGPELASEVTSAALPAARPRLAEPGILSSPYQTSIRGYSRAPLQRKQPHVEPVRNHDRQRHFLPLQQVHGGLTI